MVNITKKLLIMCDISFCIVLSAMLTHNWNFPNNYLTVRLHILWD